MALRILLVDPDQDWLDKAAAFFKEHLYQVDLALNGKDAQLALYNNQYFAVVINYATQNHPCLQVVKYIRSNHFCDTIVMVMENSTVLKTDEISREQLIKQGVTETITKPFEFNKLVELLEGQQTFKEMLSSLPLREGVSDEEEVQCKDGEFARVKIDEFYSTKAVLFDVFIRLNADHYVKILHAGDTFSPERLDKYKKQKNIDYLYFYKTDRKKYIHFANYLARKVMPNKKVTTTNKVNMLKNVSMKVVEETYAVGLKPTVVEQGKEVCESIYNMIDSQDDLYKVLRSYQDFDPGAFSHAYVVTLFASAIIKQFEWQSKATIETAALACMFHDIGKMKLPKEMQEMNLGQMNEQQIELYKKHPQFGAEIVEKNRLINNSVKQIILQHHEFYDGTGFPHQLKGQKILTLANIVCLADQFAHLIVQANITPVDGLKKILSDHVLVPRFNAMILENFIKVFVDPANKPKEYVLPSRSRVVPTKKEET